MNGIQAPARAFLVLLLVLGCTAATQEQGGIEKKSDGQKRRELERMYDRYKESFPAVGDIRPTEAMALARKGKAVLVDVRKRKEQDVSTLPGAVRQEDYLARPDDYRDKIVIGYCTISYRSGKLAESLAKKGIVMHNLRGGILAWVHDGGKVFDRNGETKRVHVYGRKWNLLPEGYEAVW